MSTFSKIPLRYFTVASHIILWVVFGSMVFLFLETIFPVAAALRRTLFNLLFLIILFYVNAKYLVNEFFEKGRYWIYLGLAMVLFAAVYFTRKLVFDYMSTIDSHIVLTLQVNEQKRVFYNTSGPGGFMLFLLLSSISQILENRLFGELEAQKKLKEEANAKLQYLRSQINPHLLFNMLNNIYSLSVSKSSKAPETILYLSEILRYSLYTTEEGEAYLNDEITQIKRYISLMQMNNENFSSVRFNVIGDVKGKKIPPMLLLPLVENCFKHSNAAIGNDGHIFMELTVKGNKLLFITDNSKENDSEKPDSKKTEVGLENIRKRLELMEGNHSLQVKDWGNKFKVELEIIVI